MSVIIADATPEDDFDECDWDPDSFGCPPESDEEEVDEAEEEEDQGTEGEDSEQEGSNRE